MSDLRYPLAWPDGWPRTRFRKSSRYKVSQDRAQRDLHRTIKLMGGRSVVLSTNLVLRRDGWPKSGQRKPSDPGVAVYFVRKGKDFCIACDKYDDVKSNIRAIGLALEGLRAVERAGVTELLDRAFQGFAKLPSAIVTTAPPDFRKVLGLDKNWPWDLTEDQAHEDLTMHYKAAARKAHPDSGGSHESSVRVNAALAEAKKVLKDWRFE